jgi:hypothetical protein
MTDSGYPFGIFWSLCCMYFDLRILVTPLVSFGHCVCRLSFDLQILVTPLISFGHYVVCPSLIDRFWLPLWNLLFRQHNDQNIPKG